MKSLRAPRVRRLPGVLLLLGVACWLTPGTLHAQDHASSPGPFVAQGDALLEQGQTGEARAAYRQALDLDESLTSAYLGLGRVDLEERQWGDAVDWFDKILKREPDRIDAHYYRGIAHRELAKFRTFNQGRHWNRAEDDFARCIQQDSLYRDVLYQFALLRRYRDVYAEAIQFGDVQVRLKPELEEAQQGLFRIYRAFINHTDPDEALAWLRAHDSPHAAYFTGETLRRLSRLDEADAVFEGLLARPLPFPVQPILLSRARLYYQKGEPEPAQGFVEQAVQQVESSLEAALVFDDVKHIISEGELALYRTLHTPEEFRAFFDGFWARRNPTPSRPANVRMAEHYRRLLIAERDYVYDGFRLWFSDPDRRGDLVYPDSYTLNREFNDKGLIFIRHGEPNDREVQVGGGDLEFRTVINNTDVYGTPSEYSYSAGWRPNESWRYHRPRRMDFHFVVEGGGGANNWRLTPALTHFGMLESREHWGPPYSEMTEAIRTMEEIQGAKDFRPSASSAGVRSLDEELTDEEAQVFDSLAARTPNMSMVAEQSRSLLEFTTMRRRMVEQSREAVTLALTTDQHTWDEEVAAIPMPYVLAAFRGEDDQTRVEIHFALPLGTITNAMEGNNGTVNVELGYAVHDSAWHAVVDEVVTKRVPTNTDPTAALIDFYQFTVPPDSYNVSIHGFTTRTSQIGGDQFPYSAPDFSQPTLAMSDVLLADYIGPAKASRFDRGDLHVSANPFQRFSTAQLVFVYFELYHLTLDENDLTRFTVEYTFTPQKSGRRGLLGRRKRTGLSVRVERSTENPSPVEYTEIDVRNVDPGDYTLTVTVTDELTGETREQSRPIELFNYE